MGIIGFKIAEKGVNTPFVDVKEQRKARSHSKDVNMRLKLRNRLFLVISLLLISFFVACDGNPLQPVPVNVDTRVEPETPPTVTPPQRSPATVLTPTFTPEEGNVPSTASLVISSGTSGASIYYTTDGSEPTSSSSSYQ